MMKSCLCFIIAVIFLVGTLELTECKAKGSDDRPPGWDKGEKKGWDGEGPPGFKNKNTEDDDGEEEVEKDNDNDDKDKKVKKDKPKKKEKKKKKDKKK